MENGKVKHSKERADQISGGVFMIGLALLFITHWWWPGIMFVIGATIIARTMAEGKDWTTATPAFWVIGIGVVFGLPGLIGGIDWATIWPLGLIALGLFMLFGGNMRPKIGRYDDDDEITDKRKNDEDDDIL
ncbi:MAG: hypothetical protein KC615_21415 [Anaerolineae bacterium]|nr:hypothetical protein [Anaerolineae bacterium]MCB9460770.1 hypothetical protein [Anaerolineaceae bacterium]